MRISGLSSGMDTEQMVKDLVMAQRIPVDRVYQQKIKAEWKRDAYRDINTKLLQLSNFTLDMRLQSTYQRSVATSSHENILTVNARGAANQGSYDIKVENLATASQVVIEDVALPDEGSSFSLSVGEKTMEITIGENDSLEKMAARINENKDLGVVAFVHEDNISFTAKVAGEVNITFKAGDGDSTNITDIFGTEAKVTETIGKDAKFSVNGIEIEQSSNTFDLNGVTVTLHEASEGTTVRVDVRHDVDAVVDKIKEFVNLYNELVDEFNLQMREETFRDYPPLTPQQREELSDKEIELWEERAKSGLLRSDPILNRVLGEMRTALGGTVQGLEGNKSLAQIGISTGSWYEYGKLNIDETKLRAAIEEDPIGVQQIFTNDGTNANELGLARRLDTVLKNNMERIKDTAGQASIPYDQSSLGNQIRDFESRIDLMEERLLRFEEAQWRKFTAMERVLGQLYAQSDWLYQQMSSMQG